MKKLITLSLLTFVMLGMLSSCGKKKEDDDLKHDYTTEQLDSVVKKLEDLDDDWGD